MKWIVWSVLVFLYTEATLDEKADLIRQYRLGFGHSYIEDAPVEGVQWNITPGTQLAMRVPVSCIADPIAAMRFALFVHDLPNVWSSEPAFRRYEEYGITYIEMTVHPD
jgi:hypothetical protein